MDQSSEDMDLEETLVKRGRELLLLQKVNGVSLFSSHFDS